MSSSNSSDEETKKEGDVFLSNYATTKESEFIKDTVGEVYEEKSALQKEIVLDFFTKAVNPRVRKGMKILDLGCGTGNTTLKFVPLVGEDGFTLGNDISEGMIKKAKEKETDKLKFSVSDCLDFSHQKDVQEMGEFDVVFSSHMLHWVKDKKSVFEQIFRNLKSGGCFIGTFGIVMSPETPVDEIVNECADIVLKDETEHVAVFMESPEHLQNILKEIGFEIEYLNFFIPKIEFRGKTEEELFQKYKSHCDTVFTLGSSKPGKREEINKLIARKTIDVAKDENHRWSNILVDGKNVNYFRFEEREEEKVFLMRCEIIEFVARKK